MEVSCYSCQPRPKGKPWLLPFFVSSESLLQRENPAVEAGVVFGLATRALLPALRRRCVEPLADQALLSAAGSVLSADFGRGFPRYAPVAFLYTVCCESTHWKSPLHTC